MTTTYTQPPEACANLLMGMAMANGALKRKDYKVARVLLDTEIREYLAASYINEDADAKRQMRDFVQQAEGRVIR